MTRRPPRSTRNATLSPSTTLFLSARSEHPRLAALGTSCPDHFLRTKVKPMVLDLPADAGIEESVARLKELHEVYRADYQAYYDAHAVSRSEEHTSELQSLMRISYAVLCLKKKINNTHTKRRR